MRPFGGVQVRNLQVPNLNVRDAFFCANMPAGAHSNRRTPSNKIRLSVCAWLLYNALFCQGCGGCLLF